MTVAVYLPLLLPALVSAIALLAADRVRPEIAVRGLAAGAVVAAAGTVWSLVLLALTLFDDVPPWTALQGRGLPEPVPDAVAVLAVAALLILFGRAVADLWRRRSTVRRLRAAGDPCDGMVVADWDEPLAVAVPGRPGHLLVTSGMLRLLDAPERRAMFAHERAHLDDHHHRAVAWVSAAAALNPLLIPVRTTVTYLVERWADEKAAASIGDRIVVARAVGRAALASSGARTPATALALQGGVIVRRVRALQCTPARSRRLLVTASALVIAGAAVACLLAAAEATDAFVTVLHAWSARIG